MAKVLLISVYDVNAEGLRILSSLLKENGHEPHILFMKRLRSGPVKSVEKDWIGIAEHGTPFTHATGIPISKREEDILVNVIGDIAPDLIGFSVCSPVAPTIKRLSAKVRKLFDLPIVWGGPQATLGPMDCVDHCDFVCVGEGDRVIVDIAGHLDCGTELERITGLTCRDQGEADAATPAALVEDLDSLPFKDVSAARKYLIEDNSLRYEFTEVSWSGRYHLISSRGCPFRCTYCCEDAFKQLYYPQRMLRRRSPAKTIAEIEQAREHLDFRQVQFEDEVFPTDMAWLEEFRDLYKQRIGLPFVCYLFPMKGIEQRIPLLKDAGLVLTVLSLQSGSERINRDVFHRPFNREVLLSCARLLDAERIRFTTDVITYNPFETERDLNDTLDILAECPKPFGLSVNKLYVLPGTEIDRLIRKEEPKSDVPEVVFDLYARLFWLTRCSALGSRLARVLRSSRLLRSAPFLINPLLFNLPFRAVDKARRILRERGFYSNRTKNVDVMK